MIRMDDIKDDTLYSVSDVCKIVGVSRSTLYRYVKEKNIPIKKIGKKSFLYGSDIKMLIDVVHI